MVGILIALCVINTMLNIYVLVHMKLPEEKIMEKLPFNDDEIDQIKQVLNILTWGGEDESKN